MKFVFFYIFLQYITIIPQLSPPEQELLLQVCPLGCGVCVWSHCGPLHLSIWNDPSERVFFFLLHPPLDIKYWNFLRTTDGAINTLRVDYLHYFWAFELANCLVEVDHSFLYIIYYNLIRCLNFYFYYLFVYTFNRTVHINVYIHSAKVLTKV
jgi:hypothetical protein